MPDRLVNPLSAAAIWTVSRTLEGASGHAGSAIAAIRTSAKPQQHRAIILFTHFFDY
jgi:hypothetical protein